MKYILPFSVVSLVHDSPIVISLEIWIPQRKLYNSQQKKRQSILQFLSSQPKRAHLENRCLAECPNENSNTSQLRLSLLLESRNMASSDKADSETNPMLLKVEYDYEYDYKTRKVSVKQGEILNLLQKTNEHWWKVERPGLNNKAFFVPAQYVSSHHNNDDAAGGHQNNDIVDEARLKRQGKHSTSSSFTHNNSPSGGIHNNNNNNNQSFESDNGKHLNKDAANLSLPNELSSFSSKAIKIGRNDATRSSHRDKAHSRLTSSSTKISLGKLKNWSASLEELSKQIVFPGLTSESVADLTAVQNYARKESKYLNPKGKEEVGNINNIKDSISSISNNENGSKSDGINKCLSFRNRAFNNSQMGSNKHLYEEKEHSFSMLETENSFQVPRAKVMERSKSKYEAFSPSNKLPDIPSPTNSPVRVLTENWAEYYSKESLRYFYYNSQSKLTSWKPPRNSPVKKPEENLGSSDASANASSFERSLENIPDLVGKKVFLKKESQIRDSTWGESSQNVFLKSSSGSNNNLSMESVSSIKMQSEDECSNIESFLTPSLSFPVPEGWETHWDEVTQQICYVNKVTGARWFTSTDVQERIYFYEENSTNSSWFLPVPDSPTTATTKIQSSTSSKLLETDSYEDSEAVRGYSENIDVGHKYGSVMKRHSAGEVADRGMRTKSLILHADHRKYLGDKRQSGSLPRYKGSIWSIGRLEVLKEGPLARTKITENGKKLRKSWGPVYAVLTESHLSLFKDQKLYISTIPKTEVEIELSGASVEWTDEKSSRKNVFQLNTLSDLQMLFQVDDKDSAEQWFDIIKNVAEESNSAIDISMRLRSTESPENLLDPVIGERKISSRLNRNKSTKVRITSSSDEPKTSKIKAHLNKFFNRRPQREYLVKKGIYKDEPVFGCSLGKLCDLENRDVPRFVEQCILAIEVKEENLKTDGIYRASGNLSQVQKIRLQVDQNNMACLLQEEDVHVLAGCLKLFFRELKEPLVPYDLYEKALQACNLHNKKEKDKVNKFREIINSLAKHNKCTLQALLKHLLKVASFSDCNRMQIPNLAIVFGPTLMWPAVESQNMALDLMQQNLVIEQLLHEYDSIFQ